MFKALNPDGVHPPFRHYIHSIEVPPHRRWLSVSGQIGVRPDGAVPDGVVAQTESAWENVLRILRANEMDVEDIVKVTQFLTRTQNRYAHRRCATAFWASTSRPRRSSTYPHSPSPSSWSRWRCTRPIRCGAGPRVSGSAIKLLTGSFRWQRYELAALGRGCCAPSGCNL